MGRKELFDKVAYGVRLCVLRKKRGYRRGKDFCSDVKEQTGLDIDINVLYRIERGEQAPTVDQILAFNFVLKTEVFKGMAKYASYCPYCGEKVV